MQYRRILGAILICASALFVAACSSDSDTKTTDVEQPPSNEDKAVSVLINELKVNIPEDEHKMQFIELKSTPGTVLNNIYVIAVDGDDDEDVTGENPGYVDYAGKLNLTVGSNGLIVIKNPNEYNDMPSATTVVNDAAIRTYDEDVDGDQFKDGILEHDSITYMVVSSATAITAGTDLDANDDGTLELPSGAVVMDSVGWQADETGIVYTEASLTQSASSPDAATRFYGNEDKNSVDAWANGDIFEDPAKDEDEMPAELLYDPAEASVSLPPNAKLTPGEDNFVQAPFVLLNEYNNGYNGGLYEYIEITANPGQSLDNIYVAVVKGSAGGVPDYAKKLSGYSVGLNGLAVIKNTASYTSTVHNSTVTISEPLFSGSGALSAGSTSVMLIYSPDKAVAVGTDLDADNDGEVDSGYVVDSIAWSTGAAGDILYGSTVFDIASIGNTVDAASRYMDNRAVSESSWTYGKLDTATAYSVTSSKNVPSGAEITPGFTNVSELTSYQVKPTLESARTTQIPPDADDPAFWIHPTDNTKSLIFATQKEAGYSVYNVSGQTLTDVNPGNVRYNNVEIMYGFSLGGQTVDLAVFSNRQNDRFAIYTISENAPYLTDVTDYAAAKLFGGDDGENTAYGLATYKNPTTGAFYAFATQNDSNLVRQFRLTENAGKVTWTLVRTITMNAGDDDEYAEGMVVDQEYGILYINQEGVGVYRVTAEPEGGDVTLDNALFEEGDYNLYADIEGISIYYRSGGEGYIIISSQGSNTFSVFDRVTNAFIASFTVIDNGKGVDGSQDCDGLDVINYPIGSTFAQGVLIVHDGQDTNSTTGDVSTNFKWIKWSDVAAELGLVVDTAYSPRTAVKR
ncbi:phytase [Seleniivibrio woodruffii]|uniref:phytase n=1 Tax=Seleniivibrio woodruffii TaxID=1078050 RepID=UPI0026F177FC|nr:phytase [Seleniivibrio woodruffii]